MLIEHRVRETVDAFTTRVRRDLDAHTRALVADLTRLFQEGQESSRGELDRAVNDARIDAERSFRARLEATRADLTRELDTRLSNERAELEAATAANRSEMREEQIATFGRLLGSIRRLDEGTSLSGILDTLARGAAVEAARVAVLIVDGDGAVLRSWGQFGFATGHGPHDMPLSDSPLLASVIGMKQTAYIPRPTNDNDPGVPSFMRMPPDHVGVAIPLIVGGDVVGVLYADGRDRRPDHASVWPEQVEMLVRHAALRLENVTSVRTVEVLTKHP